MLLTRFLVRDRGPETVWRELADGAQQARLAHGDVVTSLEAARRGGPEGEMVFSPLW
jgi:hypothetical protein